MAETETTELDHPLFEQNIAAFSRYLPHIAERLRAHSPISRLSRNADGDWDIEFRGEWLYGPGGKARAETMAERLEGTGAQRLWLGPPRSSIVDEVTSNFLVSLLKKATDDGIAFNQYPRTEETYHLVSFGLGLGYHLPALIELTRCQSICIVEPNLDFLFHSLSLMDWQPILERRKDWPLVSVVIAQTAQEIAASVRAHCRGSCPIGIDGLLVVEAYPNEAMAAAQTIFHRDGALISTGLGFMVDEMEMTRATYRNVCDGEYKLFGRQEDRLNTPAFVIGSGPSIDDDLDFIRENQDRAIIFSCGTAARVLLANGIQPDFQLLLENGEVPCDVLIEAAENFDFGDAVLLASNNVSYRIKPYFKDIVFFFRKSISSYAMFSPGDEHTLNNTSPTVTNMGLAAALGLGFSEIYLFGTDLGSRSPGAHHSRFSAYRGSKTEKAGAADDEGIVDFNGEFDSREVGNLGGIVFTDFTMGWARDSMGQAIRDAGNAVVVYNCSDGVRIPNTHPKVSESIQLSSDPAGKRADLAKVQAACPKGSAAAARERWETADGAGQVRRYLSSLVEAVPEFPDTASEFVQRLMPMLIPDHRRMPTFAEYFTRGTVMISLLCIYFYARRVDDPAMESRFKELCIEEFRRLADNMTRMTEWYFEHIDEFTILDELESRVNAWKYE